MGQVTVSINSRKYTVACDDGQEAQLVRLGRYMDQRARELTAAVGPISENLLLVMVGLLLADELSDVQGELEDLRGEGGGKAREEAEERVVQALAFLKSRIDAVVDARPVA
ncbi:cell division protein ZapA [Roseospirillum parvum]|uniref:Cell division protein ZapA n=1 Tax=Roseospirillum parvum TaxID=83401 RepID=A0A1G8EUA3_9PROT|nr:cell division protein ZapA [Roseospirillum parvum]SDH73471.1 cell division protein ZapA [Roseospirillum parvum]